jgi:hypothetical protein
LYPSIISIVYIHGYYSCIKRVVHAEIQSPADFCHFFATTQFAPTLYAFNATFVLNCLRAYELIHNINAFTSTLQCTMHLAHARSPLDAYHKYPSLSQARDTLVEPAEYKALHAQFMWFCPQQPALDRALESYAVATCIHRQTACP